MTLAQLAACCFVLFVLGTLALALDWPPLLAAADGVAVEIARYLLPVWDPFERAFLR
jgi:hypothetical protein